MLGLTSYWLVTDSCMSVIYRYQLQGKRPVETTLNVHLLGCNILDRHLLPDENVSYSAQSYSNNLYSLSTE